MAGAAGKRVNHSRHFLHQASWGHTLGPGTNTKQTCMLAGQSQMVPSAKSQHGNRKEPLGGKALSREVREGHQRGNIWETVEGDGSTI